MAIMAPSNAAMAADVSEEERAKQNSFLVESPSQEFNDYVKNASTLYQLIIESSWDAVIERCKIAPMEAKQWVVRGSIDSWRRLPLHEACIRQANVDVIRALIDAFFLAAKSFDHSARLPLHHACFHGCSIEVIRELVGAYPTALDKKDVFEKTPLILAGSSSSKNKTIIVETLMKGPSECIIEGHRSKWEREQEQMLSSIREEYNQEKSALEAKNKQITEESKRLAYSAEKEIAKKNSAIDELNKTVFDLNDRLETSIKGENAVKEKIKEMEERFSTLCVSNHVSSKKKNDKIIEQAEIIMSLEAKITELTQTATVLERKVNQKNASDAKYTKQISDLQGALDEQRKTEETLNLTIAKLRADYAQSRREVLNLVQKTAESTEGEKELESQLKEVTSELEAIKGANQTLQEKSVMLEEEVKKAKEAHDEVVRNYQSSQGRLELEQAKLNEQIVKLQRSLDEKENSITSKDKSYSEDCETYANRIAQLETEMGEVKKREVEQKQAFEKEKRELQLHIAALNDEAERVKEEVQRDQAKAQETIRLFKSALRKFTGDRDKAPAPATQSELTTVESNKEN